MDKEKFSCMESAVKISDTSHNTFFNFYCFDSETLNPTSFLFVGEFSICSLGKFNN